jgi:hypothetical protein
VNQKSQQGVVLYIDKFVFENNPEAAKNNN